MSRWLKPHIWRMLGLTLAALGLFWLTRPNPGLTPGTPAPSLQLPLVANGTGNISLVDKRDHQVTVLEFFASWCGSCRQTLPGLENAAPDVRWLSVSVDDSPAAAQRAATAWGLKRPVVQDQRGKAAQAFGLSVLPTTVILDGQGHVRRTFTGAVSRQALRQSIEQARQL